MTKRRRRQAKAISAELLDLNLKNKMVELGKQDETGRNAKKKKNWNKKHQKLDDPERNRKKREEMGRIEKKLARNGKKR